MNWKFPPFSEHWFIQYWGWQGDWCFPEWLNNFLKELNFGKFSIFLGKGKNHDSIHINQIHKEANQ